MFSSLSCKSDEGRKCVHVGVSTPFSQVMYILENRKEEKKQAINNHKLISDKTKISEGNNQVGVIMIGEEVPFYIEVSL